MGYYLKALIGGLLVIAALIAFNVALINLLKTGTCASGNTPYEISRPCPEGTGTYIVMLVGSIFGGLFGAGLFAFRGERPGSDASNDSISWGLVAWGLGFGGSGVAALVASLTGDLPAGGKVGGIIVGITFSLMGLPVLAWQAMGLAGRLFNRGDERPQPLSASRPPAPVSGAVSGGGGDAIDKIARLDQLRKSGALTESEFEREKAKLLSGN